MLTTTNLFGQLGYMYHDFPHPYLYDSFFGYPITAYFKICGPKYKITLYEIKDREHWKLKKKTVFTVRLKKDKIKTKTSFNELPYIHRKRYLYLNDSLFDSNLFWKKCEHGISNPKIIETEKDSSVLQWTYNSDGKISNSYRTIYNKQKQIVKNEVAWKYYACNDSTWLLADKNSSFIPVQRTIYEYVNPTEIKLTIERKGIKTNTVVERTIRQEYNEDKQLISEKYFDNGVNTETMLFFYKINICYKCELYEGDKLYQRTIIEY